MTKCDSEYNFDISRRATETIVLLDILSDFRDKIKVLLEEGKAAAESGELDKRNVFSLKAYSRMAKMMLEEFNFNVEIMRKDKEWSKCGDTGSFDAVARQIAEITYRVDQLFESFKAEHLGDGDGLEAVKA